MRPILALAALAKVGWERELGSLWVMLDTAVLDGLKPCQTNLSPRLRRDPPLAIRLRSLREGGSANCFAIGISHNGVTSPPSRDSAAPFRGLVIARQCL